MGLFDVGVERRFGVFRGIFGRFFMWRSIFFYKDWDVLLILLCKVNLDGLWYVYVENSVFWS